MGFCLLFVFTNLVNRASPGGVLLVYGLSFTALVLCHWCCLDRTHWSLFPVVFKGRTLPLGVYDELMGILVHGCIGEPMSLSYTSSMKDNNLDTIDVMTSRTSTFPYDNDQMQRMIELVQRAKRT